MHSACHLIFTTIFKPDFEGAAMLRFLFVWMFLLLPLFLMLTDPAHSAVL
ncbi:hypothetical protein [Salipiger sp. CCB-MM3]|nr:hypothetical protein [Salipiger sp. CCB-MM3]